MMPDNALKILESPLYCLSGGDGVKVNIKVDGGVQETEVTIVCRQIDPELEAVISSLGLINNTVSGKRDGETFFTPLGDILYFETIEGRTFYYTNEHTYETATKLYQLEEKLADTPFVRVSKSAIMNLRKVLSIKSEENSKLIATLTSGDKLIVSRQYMQTIKMKLGV
jgi:DNA-binding LytR/AlgR family response regulator